MKPTLALYLALSVSTYALDSHVEAVINAVKAAHGKFEKTEDGQSLKLVDLAVPGAGPHDHRTNDPYDAAFFEHLGHITTLESLNVISTKANDEWIAPLANLTQLKSLRFTNNGKLTDAGMAYFAGLKNLENFSFVGTAITGRAYAQCTDWTRVTKVSHRGSSIDDEGLQQLCDHLPNLESISLAHAKFTDAGAVHLAKLNKLKGLELGTHNATPAALKHLAHLPLEYLQLGEGFESVEAIAFIKTIPSLRRLTLTNAADLSNEDLKQVAGLTQLEQLELGKIAIPDERVEVLQSFGFLKAMRIVPGKVPFTAETQAKIKALLPKTELTFK
ncbi:MAG: G protein-coupled receptor LGR4 [Verrucomicrobiales bacterium]|nr:G protein-coupled receptor LGR4 [Verrucomicrobiales bacterium]MCP5556618.1 G protein-coupled receptor LGR4 [Verrucomicrobiaceae bacterium]